MKMIIANDEDASQILKKLDYVAFGDLSKSEKKTLVSACKYAVEKMKLLTNYNLFVEYQEIVLDEFPPL